MCMGDSTSFLLALLARDSLCEFMDFAHEHRQGCVVCTKEVYNLMQGNIRYQITAHHQDVCLWERKGDKSYLNQNKDRTIQIFHPQFDFNVHWKDVMFSTHNYNDYIQGFKSSVGFKYLNKNVLLWQWTIFSKYLLRTLSIKEFNILYKHT